MLSDVGTVEEIEDPREVTSEPCKDQRETPDDSQPESCTPQGETPDDFQPGLCTPQGETPNDSQPEPYTPWASSLAQRQVLATWDQTVMTSESCNTPLRTFTQNSKPHSEEDMDYQFGEPNETIALYQHGVSADQKKSSAVSQPLELNTHHTLISESQERTVPDSRKTVYKEDSQVKTHNGNQALVIHSTASCGRQRTSSGDYLDDLLAVLREDIEGSHERSYSCDQTMDVNHIITFLLDQTTQRNYQEMPFTWNQTSHCSQPKARTGEQFPYKDQMAAPSYSQSPHPSQVLTSSSAHTSCSCKKSDHDMTIFWDHLVAIKGYNAFYKHQMRDPNSAQINHYGQLTSSHGQNVYPGQGTVPRVGECLHPRVISFSGGDSSLHSGYPLTPRQPSESVSVSAFVQGQLPQGNLYCKCKSHDCPKRTKNRKRHLCPFAFCSKSFSRFSYLRYHMRIHTGETPYGCHHPGCGAKFSSLHMLIQHGTMHTEEYP